MKVAVGDGLLVAVPVADGLALGEAVGLPLGVSVDETDGLGDGVPLAVTRALRRQLRGCNDVHPPNACGLRLDARVPHRPAARGGMRR